MAVTNIVDVMYAPSSRSRVQPDTEVLLTPFDDEIASTVEAIYKEHESPEQQVLIALYLEMLESATELNVRYTLQQSHFFGLSPKFETSNLVQGIALLTEETYHKVSWLTLNVLYQFGIEPNMVTDSDSLDSNLNRLETVIKELLEVIEKDFSPHDLWDQVINFTSVLERFGVNIDFQRVHFLLTDRYLRMAVPPMINPANDPELHVI